MVRYLRGLFERAAVLQVSGDARRPEGVIADARDEAGGFGAPLNHLIGIRLGQGMAGELAGRTAVGLEQHRLRIVREARTGKIFMQVRFEVVMARHGVLLAPFSCKRTPSRQFCGSGGIGWHDLAHHKPVEQVAKRRKPLLDARRGKLARLRLDPCGDVRGYYVR